MLLIAFFFVSLPMEIPAHAVGRTTLWNLAFAIYSRTFRKLGGGKNNARIKSECPRYAWAFGLSCIVGFRQVPLNVDESIRPRFVLMGACGGRVYGIKCTRINN